MKTKELVLLLSLLIAGIMQPTLSRACQASFTVSAQNPNSNTFSFTNTSTGNYSSVFWSFGDGTAGYNSNATHTYQNPGAYVVCLTIFDSLNGCQSTFCDSVLVGQGTGCNAAFTVNPLGNGSFLFQNQSSGSGNTYFWSFGDGSSSANTSPIHSYAATGTYSVCLTVVSSSGCSDTFCLNLIAQVGSNPNCDAQFFASDSAGMYYFFPQVYSPNWTYFWSFGDGTTSTSPYPVHSYFNSGPWLACLTVTDSAQGCSVTWCDSVGSQLQCPTWFNHTINPSGSVSFTSFTDTASAPVNYFWDFGDGSTSNQANPTHTYSANSTYWVCLTVAYANGCGGTSCYGILINNSVACDATFGWNAGPNNQVFFNAAAQGNNLNYFWSFGDGSSSPQANPVHNYAQGGLYTVCLTVSDSLQGCTATWCDSIWVQGNSGCNAQFGVYDSAGTYYFLPVAGAGYSYFWDFGDGNTSTQAFPSHIYNSNGTYTVCLYLGQNGAICDSSCTTITVGGGSACQAYFSAVMDSNNTAYFVNMNSGPALQYVWSFGDGNSGSGINPVHNYANPGTYLVCLTVFGPNCQDSYCDSLAVGSGSNCIPLFYAYPDSVVGNGVVNFVMTNSCPGWQYVWAFGDSTTASGTGPFSHQYPATGMYYVCVTAFDNQGNQLTWCDSVSAFRIGGSTGLSETGNAVPVSVFPNPVREQMSIRFELKEGSETLMEIHNLQGQLLYSSNNFYPAGISELRLDPSGWNSGLYLLRIITPSGYSFIRFSVQQ